MKKFFAALLTLAMTAALLAGCGSSGSTGSTSAAAPAASGSAAASDIDWPKENITLVVPYSAGGDTDTYARQLAQGLTKELGTNVVCADNESRNINILLYGGLPIYEPGLEDMVHRNVSSGRLTFSTDLGAAMKSAEVVFCCVETPPAKDGGTDMTRVEDMAREFGRNVEKYMVLVIKSPVPVGSAKRIKQIILLRIRGV